LSLHNFPFGDLSPDSLFVDSEGEVKLLSTYLLTGYKNALDRGFENLGYETCYSPE